MTLRALFWTCISAAMAVSAVSAAASTPNQCVAGEPSAASYTWDFKSEANTIFKDLQTDAEQALYHADKLQSFAGDPNLDWQVHADQLERVKSAINEMGADLCRLETIRRVVSPWQQREIDRIAMSVRLMADNTEDAIRFGDTKPRDLWLGTYHKYLNNLYNEADGLAKSVRDAVQFTSVSKEYQELRRDLGARTTP